MKNIVVTGGAGFLGSHLCERLLKYSNTRVFCVDNLYTGKKENIKHLFKNPRFKFINQDIIEPFFLNDVPLDQIYNLACPASPVHYQYAAIRTVKANVLGVINMLGMAKKHKARILQASTSEVYGDPEEHPQSESYRGNVHTLGPRACYDEGKRCAETLFMDYKRTHNLDIRLVRIFNTYGPRMAENDGRVVSNFIAQALRNEDITIFGDGNQTRSFCYFSDLIDVMIRIMNQEKHIGPINIGNPGEFTIKELAQKVIKLTNSSSKLIYTDLPEDDPKVRKPDISLAKKVVGWTPKVKLDEGLRHTIQYFKKTLIL